MPTLSTIQRPLILPAVLFLAVLAAQCSMLNLSVFADEYGDFDPGTGQYRYHNLPGNPSPGHDGWNSYQRQQEQMERYRQESLNAEIQRERNANASDTLVPRSTGPTYVYPPDGGRMVTCWPTFNRSVICQ